VSLASGVPGYLERGEYNPSLDLALRATEHFDLRSRRSSVAGHSRPCLPSCTPAVHSGR